MGGPCCNLATTSCDYKQSAARVVQLCPPGHLALCRYHHCSWQLPGALCHLGCRPLLHSQRPAPSSATPAWQRTPTAQPAPPGQPAAHRDHPGTQVLPVKTSIQTVPGLRGRHGWAHAPSATHEQGTSPLLHKFLQGPMWRRHPRAMICTAAPRDTLGSFTCCRTSGVLMGDHRTLPEAGTPLSSPGAGL